MIRIRIRVVVAMIFLSLTLQAGAAELVREFVGSGAKTTAGFEVQAPWILDWRLDGDFDQLVALDVTLVDARTGRHLGRVLHTKNKGNGVKLFNDGGKYQLRISSSLARWRIKIEQLTPEEAEFYTPRQKEQKPFYE